VSDLLNKMMEANKLSNEQAKAESEARREARRHELAGAMTRMVVNEALGRVQQAKQENEALAEKARAEKK
jgi:hypothetical protein